MLINKTGLGIMIAALGLFTMGCEQAGPTDAPDEPAVAEAPLAGADAEAGEAPAARHHGDKGRRGKFGKHRRGGPGTMLLHEALEDLELTDAQRASLETLDNGMKPDEASKSAHRELRATLAAGARAGQLDDAAIERAVASLKTEGAAKQARMLENLNTLHATLTPEQRTSLVANIKARKDGCGGPDGEGHARRRGGGAEQADGPRERHGRAGKRGRVGKLLRGIDLTEDQRAQLDEFQESRPSHEGKKERFSGKREKMTAMLDAFASASFDAKAVVADRDMGEHMQAKLNGKLEMVRALLGILDEGQREALAANLEREPHRGKRGHHGRDKHHLEGEMPEQDAL